MIARSEQNQKLLLLLSGLLFHVEQSEYAINLLLLETLRIAKDPVQNRPVLCPVLCRRQFFAVFICREWEEKLDCFGQLLNRIRMSTGPGPLLVADSVAAPQWRYSQWPPGRSGRINGFCSFFSSVCLPCSGHAAGTSPSPQRLHQRYCCLFLGRSGLYPRLRAAAVPQARLRPRRHATQRARSEIFKLSPSRALSLTQLNPSHLTLQLSDSTHGDSEIRRRRRRRPAPAPSE